MVKLQMISKIMEIYRNGGNLLDFLRLDTYGTIGTECIMFIYYF